MNADQSTDLKGWLPVDAVVVDGRPGLWWMEMSGVSWRSRSFSRQSSVRKRERRERFHEFDVLLQLEKAAR
jgi:hypothetical protein